MQAINRPAGLQIQSKVNPNLNAINSQVNIQQTEEQTLNLGNGRGAHGDRSGNGRGTHGDQSGRLRSRHSERHAGGSLDPESGDRNPNTSIPGTSQDTENHSRERIMHVMEIPSTVSELEVETYILFMEDNQRTGWQRFILSQWELTRQKMLILDVLRQVMSIWMGWEISYPYMPYHLHIPSMKVVSWNSQCAGNESFRRNFQDLVRSHQSSVVFLLETRVSEDNAYDIAPTLGFTDFRIATTDGMSGGVWMLWNQLDIDVEVTEVEEQGIHAILSPCQQEPWMISGIYAKPDHQERSKFSRAWRILQTPCNCLARHGGL